MPQVLDAYVAGLQRELASPHTRVEALTGVIALLDALVHRSHCVVGLLTGNLERGAQHKLTAAGIEFDRFALGAYGSDHEIRAELPAIAQRRARETSGSRSMGASMVIVGDTPATSSAAVPSVRARSPSPPATTRWTRWPSMSLTRSSATSLIPTRVLAAIDHA